MGEDKAYSSKDIIVLEGLNAVRMRPGMYIGTTGIKGMHHLLWEIVDNAIDELSNGFGNTLTVTLHQDGSASVEDDGRGIPVDIHASLKVSAVEVVFTQLHAGGKFNNKSYGFSGGLHGVGASVANALSSWLEVEVHKNGKIHKMRFEPKKKDDGKFLYGQAVAPLAVVGKTEKTGTKVTFHPDRSVFKYCQFHFETITKRLKELAFLNKGIEIIVIDERITEESQPDKKVYKYDGGISDFVNYLNETKNPLHDKPIFITAQSDLIRFECALQYTDAYVENVFSYVNNIPTSEGGTHETGFKAGLTRIFNDLARRFGYLKDKEQNLMGEDYREGLTAVVAIKMREVQFEGQTKTKLGNPEAKPEIERFVIETLGKYFERIDKDAALKKLYDTIMNKAKGAAKVREEARKVKEIARQKNSLDGAVLIGKLSSCTGKRAELNELFIVEGDSAGGTAKQARDRSFQAILPLRGKPLNAEKKRISQVLENEEFRTIISALGTSIGEDFTLENLKYHKVVILADAD
ncbi:MAG: ATP-binding protein, partial [Firmicutes bacterium]|nr:ATP-binding protein [Bacillota bacterium]